MFMLLLLLLLGVLVLPCCGPAGSATDSHQQPSIGAEQVRLVSLSPAISRTLVDLELDHLIVGRTPYCDMLAPSVPIVGDLLDINWELLVRVRPTHVLVQPPAGGLNPKLQREANARGWQIGAWHLDEVAEIKTLLRELPQVVFHDDAEQAATAAQRAQQLISRIDTVLGRSDPNAFTGRTLLVISTEPVTVFGEETYLHELLVALGGRNAVSMRAYPQLTLEDVTRLNPEAIVLVHPGSKQQANFGPLSRLQVDAVRERRMAVLSHPGAFTPSSSVAAVAEELREVLRELATVPEPSTGDAQ